MHVYLKYREFCMFTVGEKNHIQIFSLEFLLMYKLFSNVIS